MLTVDAWRRGLIPGHRPTWGETVVATGWARQDDSQAHEVHQHKHGPTYVIRK